MSARRVCAQREKDTSLRLWVLIILTFLIFRHVRGEASPVPILNQEMSGICTTLRNMTLP